MHDQNAWGGENIFLHIWRDGFGYRATNPCLSLRVVHMHCALPTQFGVHIVGDQRLGKKVRSAAAWPPAKLDCFIHLRPGSHAPTSAIFNFILIGSWSPRE